MNKTEKVILQKLSKRLRNSTSTSWREGGLEQWADYAKNMSAIIRTSCDSIDGLLEASEEEGDNNQNKPLTLD